jgi:hypothetical protein
LELTPTLLILMPVGSEALMKTLMDLLEDTCQKKLTLAK